MNNYTIKYIFNAIDKMSPVFKKMQSNLAKLNTQMRKSGEAMKKFGGSIKYYSMAAAGGLALMLKGAMKLENMETSFKGILGGAEAAKNMVAKLNDFTARTPFQLEAVARSAQSLMPFMEQEEVMNSLQMVGDVAAATGRSMESVMLPFAKAVSTNKVQGELFNMLAEKGIPILKVMAKRFKTTTAGVLEMGAAGKITFKHLQEAFATMTGKGGFAYQGMINQSKTLGGLWSTLKDNFSLTAAVFGDQLLPYAKRLAYKLIDITASMRAWAKANPALAKLVVILLGIVAVASPILIFVGQLAIGLTYLIPILGSMGAAVLAITWPVALAIAAIAALTYGAYKLYQNFDAVKNFFANSRLGHLMAGMFKISILPMRALIEGLRTIVGAAESASAALGKLNVFKHGKAALGALGADIKGAWDWATGDISNPMGSQAMQLQGAGGALNGNININNNTGFDATSDIEKVGIAKGVGVNMGQAVGG